MLRAAASPNAVTQSGNATLGTATVTTIVSQNAAKAWGNFNGTSTGTITSAVAYNATIVRTGTGTYSITFGTVFGNGSYPIVASSISRFTQVTTQSTSGATIITGDTNQVAQDSSIVSFVVFGTVP